MFDRLKKGRSIKLHFTSLNEAPKPNRKQISYSYAVCISIRLRSNLIATSSLYSKMAWCIGAVIIS